MTILYTNDLEAETHNTVPPTMTSPGNTVKVFDKTISPSIANMVAQGNKALMLADVGDYMHITSGLSTSLGDCDMVGAQRIESLSHLVNIVLRGTLASTNGYYFMYDHSSGNLRGRIVYYNAGSTDLVTSAYNFPVVVGDIVWSKARAIGNTLSLFLWKNSDPEPGSPIVTTTHSGYPTGCVGVRKAAGGGVYAGFDSITVTDGAGGGSSVKNELNFLRRLNRNINL